MTAVIPRRRNFTYLFIIISSFLIMNCSTHYNGEISNHYDGDRFFLVEEGEVQDSSSNFLSWFESLKSDPWPKWIEDPPQIAPPKRIKNDGLRITYINQSTMLIQIDNINILTDPIWSQRASPFSWIGPKRVRAPGVAMKDLPVIDIILISHNHYDHLNIATLKRLSKKDNPQIFVGLGVPGLLKSEGLNNIIEMDWWQKYTLKNTPIKIIFVPAKHHSGRGLFDKNKTLWGGYVIESNAGRIYFAGDTAYGSFLTSIKERFDGFRLALIPIGHYKPRRMMKSVHLNPDEAVMLHHFLNIKYSVAMHFSTFGGFGGHTVEKIDDPENDLHKALIEHGILQSEFWTLEFGEGRDVPL